MSISNLDTRQYLPLSLEDQVLNVGNKDVTGVEGRVIKDLRPMTRAWGTMSNAFVHCYSGYRERASEMSKFVEFS